MPAGDLVVALVWLFFSCELCFFVMCFFPLYFSREWKLNQKFNLSHLVCVNNDLENDLVSLLEDQDQVSQPLLWSSAVSTWKVRENWKEKFTNPLLLLHNSKPLTSRTYWPIIRKHTDDLKNRSSNLIYLTFEDHHLQPRWRPPSTRITFYSTVKATFYLRILHAGPGNTFWKFERIKHVPLPKLIQIRYQKQNHI